MNGPLGLIAGEGVFPVLVARGARAAGRKVVCVGLRGAAWPELRQECERFDWAGVLRLNRWIRLLRREGCREAIMVGRVPKDRMYGRWRYFQYVPDWRIARLWFMVLRHDKRPQAVLQALVRELGDNGIQLIDSTTYCRDQLVTAGVMTRRQPTAAQWQDIEYGWGICRAISGMDIGQSIAVLNRDVIAVEALEGTNVMIERAGQLCRSGGWTLIKVANARQDMRVDVPSVGVTTVEKMREAGGTCIVLEPGKTIMLEKQKVLELADRYGIAVVGREEAA
jgi:UDP-2,3-diacylglucosamine hydrolase